MSIEDVAERKSRTVGSHEEWGALFDVQIWYIGAEKNTKSALILLQEYSKFDKYNASWGYKIISMQNNVYGCVLGPAWPAAELLTDDEMDAKPMAQWGEGVL